MLRPQFTDLLPMSRAASFFTFTTVSLDAATRASPTPDDGCPGGRPMV